MAAALHPLSQPKLTATSPQLNASSPTALSVAIDEGPEAALHNGSDSPGGKFEQNQGIHKSLSHMNTTTGVFDKHNVVVQRMINMTRNDILWI